jgi:hypothetical protein
MKELAHPNRVPTYAPSVHNDYSFKKLGSAPVGSVASLVGGRSWSERAAWKNGSAQPMARHIPIKSERCREGPTVLLKYLWEGCPTGSRNPPSIHTSGSETISKRPHVGRVWPRFVCTHWPLC